MTVSVDFRKSELLPDGAERFFKIFSRFEFALKESGFLPEKDGRALANWNAFAGALTMDFFDDVVRSGRADTLLHNPPKRQISRNRSLSFEPTEAPKNTQQLLEAICMVRNNLFHGGKSGDPDADYSDPHRNEKLIAESQWVLELALERHNDVRFAFEGRY